MGARTAIIWAGVLAAAFGLGWWHAQPPTLDPGTMAASLKLALDDKNPLRRVRELARLFEALTPANIDEAFEVIEAEPLISDNELQLLMYAWTRFDPDGAFEAAVISQQQMVHRRGTAAATYYWAMENPKAALYWVETIDDTAFREFLTEHLILGWALSSERDTAALYISTLPRGRLRQLATSLIQAEYMKDGPEAVVAWVESLPEEIHEQYRRDVFQRAANQLAQRDPEFTAKWIGTHFGNDYARGTARLVANEWFKTEPQKAVEWVIGLPVNPPQATLVHALFGRWYDATPAKARSWLEAQILLPAHDPALEVLARRISDTRPRQAIRWAELIQGPTRRENVLVAVAQEWHRDAPDAAVTWIEQSSLSENARIAARKPPRNVEPVEPSADKASLSDSQASFDEPL